MKYLAALIVFVPLLALGALPADAQSYGPGAGARPSVVSDARAAREAYVRRMNDDMREWQQKLQEHRDRSQVRGRNVVTRADRQLNRVWLKTASASQKLRTAGPRGWRAAKAAYEQSTRELDQAWTRVRRQASR